MKKICFLGASQHFHALSHAPLRSSLPAYPPLLPPLPVTFPCSLPCSQEENRRASEHREGQQDDCCVSVSVGGVGGSLRDTLKKALKVHFHLHPKNHDLAWKKYFFQHFLYKNGNENPIGLPYPPNQ